MKKQAIQCITFFIKGLTYIKINGKLIINLNVTVYRDY